MSRIQIALSPDLRRLRDERFNVHVNDAGFLLVRDIPYVNSKGKAVRGTLVSNLDLAGDVTAQPADHVAWLVEEDYACYTDGTEITRVGRPPMAIGVGVSALHSYSRKPERGHFLDYYEKVTTYVDYFGKFVAPLDSAISAKTGIVDEPLGNPGPFLYPDTASSRAEINEISVKVADEVVGIIGLGGTGSYVFDLVSKTHVKAIHLFDADRLLTHNLFRAPGAPTDREELRLQPRKVEYYKRIYERFRRGIVSHPLHMNASNAELLAPVTFAFLCMEGGPDKRAIVEKLESLAIPFIDVGMGLYVARGKLGGTLRVTLSTVETREAARSDITFKADDAENEYDKNIQIVELNALNACLAVLTWKKLRRVYADLSRASSLFFSIAPGTLTTDRKGTEEDGE